MLRPDIARCKPGSLRWLSSSGESVVTSPGRRYRILYGSIVVGDGKTLMNTTFLCPRISG
jgi:hypothetical protein